MYLNAPRSYYLIARKKWVSCLPGLELLLELSLHLLAGFRCSHLLIGDDVLEIQIILDDESSGEEMVVVDELDEGLESALSIDFLLAHASGDLSWGALNSDDESVGELLVLHSKLKNNKNYLLAIVVLLDNDCLLASSSTCEQNDNSAFSHAKTKVKDPAYAESAQTTPRYASET